MPDPLIEGVDYYIENGLFVFTEHFLRKRGYCCESGCRHCPYGYRRDARSDVPSSDEPIDDDANK